MKDGSTKILSWDHSHSVSRRHSHGTTKQVRIIRHPGCHLCSSPPQCRDRPTDGFLIQICTSIAALDQINVVTKMSSITSALRSVPSYTQIGGSIYKRKLHRRRCGPSFPIFGAGNAPSYSQSPHAGSLAICMASFSMTMLIVGRAFQRTAAESLTQIVNTTTSDSFSTGYIRHLSSPTVYTGS